MSLSFKEKRALQKIVSEKLVALRGGTLSFKEKREAQRVVKDALSKLKVKTPGSTPSSSPFDDLIAGHHNGLAVADFIEKLKAAYSQEDDLEKAREAALVYYDSRQEEFADVA